MMKEIQHAQQMMSDTKAAIVEVCDMRDKGLTPDQIFNELMKKAIFQMLDDMLGKTTALASAGWQVVVPGARPRGLNDDTLIDVRTNVLSPTFATLRAGLVAWSNVAEWRMHVPSVTPGFALVIDGQMPIALQADDKVEVITSNGMRVIDKVRYIPWHTAKEWRLMDNSVRAHEADGYKPHDGEALPAGMSNSAIVDVTFDNGRMVYGVLADDVDWKYAKYWRVANPS
jgi:hypothetical protein